MHLTRTQTIGIPVVGLLLVVFAFLVGYLVLHTEHYYTPRTQCVGWWVFKVWRLHDNGNPVLFIRIFGHTFAIYKYPLV